jgi:hypothetical protein
MKTKRFLSLVVAGALMANMALFGLAFAEDTTSDQEITGVSLYFKSMVPAQNFSNVVASTSSQISNNVFDDMITIAGATNITNGIEVTVQSTPMYRTSDYAASFTTGSSSLDWQTDSDDSLQTVGTPLGVTCNQFNDITVAEALTDTSGGDGSVSDTTDTLKIIDDSTTGDVNFECGFNPELDLTIPGGQAIGTYQTTTTFAIADA